MLLLLGAAAGECSDYSPSNLAEILEMHCRKKGFKLEEVRITSTPSSGHSRTDSEGDERVMTICLVPDLCRTCSATAVVHWRT